MSPQDPQYIPSILFQRYELKILTKLNQTLSPYYGQDP